MLAIITQLVASGILSIKRAAVGATFDPQISIQALVTSSFFLLRKSAQNPFTTHCEHSKIYTKGREITFSGWFFFLPEAETKKQKKNHYHNG